MQPNRLILVGLIAAAAGLSGRAQAKDLYYHLGYGRVEVIDGDRDVISASIKVKGWVREAALTSDKKFLYVTTNRHLVHKIDLGKNEVVATVDVSSGGWDRLVFGFAMAPGDRTAYTAMMSRRIDGGEVVIGTPVVAEVELETGKVLRSVEVPWGVARLIVVKGGRSIYAFGKDLYEIDASGAELKLAKTTPMFEKKWNILPLWEYGWENAGFSVVNYYTPEFMGLLTVDATTGEITDMPLKGDPVFAYSVTVSPDRKTAYAVMDDLNVIDMVGKKYGKAIPIQEGTSYGVQVSSDGKKIYVGGGGSSVTVYDARTLKQVKVIKMATDGMDIRRVTF
jgi:DNA-binding beta-propeller fold protein YncE